MDERANQGSAMADTSSNDNKNNNKAEEHEWEGGEVLFAGGTDWSQVEAGKNAGPRKDSGVIVGN